MVGHRLSLMRILFSTAEPHPTFRADVAILFGKYLPRHGIHTDLLTRAASDDSLVTPWGGGRALCSRPPRNRLEKILGTLWHDLKMLRLASRGYDCVQVRDKVLSGVIGLFAARLASIPFYYWMSFPVPEGWLHFARQRKLSIGIDRWLFSLLRGYVTHFVQYRFLLPHADHVFVQSERMKEDLARKGLDPRKMTPVPMGVDFETAATEVSPIDDPRLLNHRVLIYMGGLDALRRPEIMIEAMPIVLRDHPSAFLVMVGDAAVSTDMKTLQSLAQQLGVAEHVLFTGWLPTTTAWRYGAAAEIGLSPCPRNDLLDPASPTKIVEYLALGVPVVGNDQPDQACVLAASGGGLCVEHTAEGFAQGISTLLSEPGQCKQMGIAGRAFVAKNRSYAVLASALAKQYAVLSDNHTLSPYPPPGGGASV